MPSHGQISNILFLCRCGTQKKKLTVLLGNLLHSCPTSTKVKNIRYLATTWHIAEPSHLQPSNFVDFTVPRDQGTKGDVA